MRLALSTDLLDRMWPEAPHSLVDAVARSSADAFARFGIDQVVEVTDFMAQTSEESGGGWEVEEDLNYTAVRLCQVWPGRFPTPSAAGPFAHNPRALADCVYGGRMGNRPGTDDGWRYRGRGLIQLTGRNGYAAIAKETGLPLVDNPDLALSLDHILEVAAAFWKFDDIDLFADRGDFRGETVRLNGALTNYDLRVQWRKSWAAAFAAHSPIVAEPAPPAPAAPAEQGAALAPVFLVRPPEPPQPAPTIGPAAALAAAAAPAIPAANLNLDTVAGVCAALNRLGAAPPLPAPLPGQPVAGFRDAVVKFQTEHGCDVDGDYGPQTKRALKLALGLGG